MASISQELREAVLQAAIQGKLTEQLPEDGDARELLEQIKAQKERLIKEKKIKKEKPLEPISEDEVPFDIPENWKWSKLGEICSVYGGKRIPAGRKLSEINTGHKYIRVSDMQNGTVDETNIMYVPEDIYSQIQRYTISKDDVYITVAGTIGRVGTVPDSLDGANLTENADKLCLYGAINKEWLVIILNSALVQNQISEATTQVGQPKLAIIRIQELYIPLPPLAEQHRIVARVEELMAKIDELEKVENELKALHQAFPRDMKAALLQAAMQGKLTERLPEDGNAEDLLKQIKAEKERLVTEKKIKKEKPIAPISEDDIPFEIPENWKWTKLGELLQFVSDGTHKTPTYVNQGVPFLSVKDISKGFFDLSNTKYISKEEHELLCSRCKPSLDDILVCRIGTLGKAIKITVPFEFSIFVSLGLLRPVLAELSDYLVLLINSPHGTSWIDKVKVGGGTHTNKINLNSFPDFVIPLPPLAEQHRIVERLNKLLPLCDSLQTES